MSRESVIALLVAMILCAEGVSATIDVTWVTRYGNEEIQVIPDASVPDTYVRMWRDISNSALYDRPEYLVGATYLQRRTNYINNYQELDGIGELYDDWLGENRVAVSEDCTILVAIRWIDDTRRQQLVSEGWWDLQDTISIQRYPQYHDAFDLFAHRISAGVVSVPTAIEPSRLVFLFQSNDKISAIPEPSSLVVFAVLGLMGSIAANRRRGGRRWDDRP